jgi:hypothetical protein
MSYFEEQRASRAWTNFKKFVKYDPNIFPHKKLGAGSGLSRMPGSRIRIKGTVSRDFLLLVLFMNQFLPSPRVFH